MFVYEKGVTMIILLVYLCVVLSAQCKAAQEIGSDDLHSLAHYNKTGSSPLNGLEKYNDRQLRDFFKSLPEGVEETHISLFDGSNCGIRLTDRPVFSVQYHPEASPGPQDSYYLFERFVAAMD